MAKSFVPLYGALHRIFSPKTPDLSPGRKRVLTCSALWAVRYVRSNTVGSRVKATRNAVYQTAYTAVWIPSRR